MIPKIIHCFWAGGQKTKLAEKCRASWEKFAPGWEIREWGGEGLEGLGGLEFFREAVAARKWAMASDWMRMAVLKEYGGVYLDYDVELIRPFNPPDGEWVAGEWTASGGVWMNPGSGIALEKDSAVARHMLDAYDKLAFDPKREMMPWINEHLGSSEGLAVLEPEVLSAVDVRGRVHVTDRTLGIHHYALSWGSPKQKMLQWISWHGGRWAIDLLLGIRRAWRNGGRT